MTTKRTLTAMAVLMLATLALFAATPPALVNYQGVLRNSSNAPLSGSYDMVFKFYDDPSAGTLLLTDTHNSGAPCGQVAVTNGLFTAALGAGTLTAGSESALDAVFLRHSPVYLEVTVGTDPAMTPRVQVMSSAYSQNAGSLQGVVIVSGDSVGIGTTSPGCRLDVQKTTAGYTNCAISGYATTGTNGNVGVSGAAISPVGTPGAIGGIFYGEGNEPLGTAQGVVATASGSGTCYAVDASAVSTGSGSQAFALRGRADSQSGPAYSVYGMLPTHGSPRYAGYFAGDVGIVGALKDSTGSAGTSGQVLQSTVTGIQWASGGGNADTVDGFHASSTATANYLYPLDASAKIPNARLYTGAGNGLDADTVDAIHASSTPTTNYLYPLGAGAKFPNSVLNTGSGNGLDADLLDGQHGSYYQNAGNINAGILGVGYGGTGLAAPGTTGNVLTSDGSVWVSSAPGGGAGWTISGSNEYASVSGNVGIGTATPTYKLNVEQTVPPVPGYNSFAFRANAENGTQSNVGVSSRASAYNVSSGDPDSYGGSFTADGPSNGGDGHTIGVSASAHSFLWANCKGLTANASASGNGQAFGITAEASSASGPAYSIYAYAPSSGNPKYAGYFNGDVRINGALWDSSGAAGTSGQLLSSTGTGTSWIAPSVASGWTISGNDEYASVSGNVGIGTATPNSKLDVQQTVPPFPGLTSYAFRANAENGTQSNVGVSSSASAYNVSSGDPDSYGGSFTANGPSNGGDGHTIGVSASAHSYLWANCKGLSAYASASGNGQAIGINAEASSASGPAYSIYASAPSSGNPKYAGYFNGDTYIDTKLGIGTASSLAWPLTVQATQSVGLFTSTANSPSVVDLRNTYTTSTPTVIGAINFSTASTYPGQIAYLGTSNAMTFNTNSSERVRIDSSGYVGIGLTPSYRLQLSSDSAAKPSTNTWTIASDARLKKDIAPFTDGLSILEKINPIRYRYNGLAGLPRDVEGIGVVAQEIRSVAPYTVGTFKAKLNDRDETLTELFDFNSHALTFVMINAIKELDERTKSLVSSSSESSNTSGRSRNRSHAQSETAPAAAASTVSPEQAAPAPSAAPAGAAAPAYPVCETVEQGDVLVADPAHPGVFCLGRQPSDRRVVGIAAPDSGSAVSANPQEAGEAVAFVPMNTSGITSCKADATLGPIEIGDLLVTSANPGHAMKAANPAPGTVIGKALEPLESGTGLIQVLVMLR